jgi:hypothetical protein
VFARHGFEAATEIGHIDAYAGQGLRLRVS